MEVINCGVSLIITKRNEHNFAVDQYSVYADCFVVRNRDGFPIHPLEYCKYIEFDTKAYFQKGKCVVRALGMTYVSDGEEWIETAASSV